MNEDYVKLEAVPELKEGQELPYDIVIFENGRRTHQYGQGTWLTGEAIKSIRAYTKDRHAYVTGEDWREHCDPDIIMARNMGLVVIDTLFMDDDGESRTLCCRLYLRTKEGFLTVPKGYEVDRDTLARFKQFLGQRRLYAGSKELESVLAENRALEAEGRLIDK